MPILILGGRGNLGCQLTKVFSEDYQVFSWDREDLDVLDFSNLREKILALSPRLIINTVAYNAVDLCEEEEGWQQALKMNRELPGALADIALESEAVLIHYSSDYVFNGTEDKEFFLENETPNPINKYGESKFWGEMELEKRKKSNLNYYLIRTSKLFGPPSQSINSKASFFELMLSLALEGKKLSVVNEELSCFTYTPDLAMATKRLWELKLPFGDYHLVNEGPCNWYEALQEFFSLQKIKIELRAVRSEDLSRAARRPKFSVLKNTKVKKMRNFSQAMIDYVEYLKNN